MFGAGVKCEAGRTYPSRRLPPSRGVWWAVSLWSCAEKAPLYDGRGVVSQVLRLRDGGRGEWNVKWIVYDAMSQLSNSFLAHNICIYSIYI